MRILTTIFISLAVGMFRLFAPAGGVVHAHGEPQTGVFQYGRAIPNEAFATSPVTGYGNGVIYTVPLKRGEICDINGFDICAYAAAIDASHDVTIAIKTVTAAGVADETLVSGVSIKSTAIADKVSLNLWTGSKRLTAGMSVVYEITATTPDTAGFGYNLTVEGKVIARSAQ